MNKKNRNNTFSKFAGADTFMVIFKVKVNISLLNEEPYFSKNISWNYFNKDKGQGVFRIIDDVDKIHRKMADKLNISYDDIQIMPHTEGLTNLYYGTV